MTKKNDVLAGTWEENTYGKTYLKFWEGKVQVSFDDLCFKGTYEINDDDTVTIMLNSYSSPVVYNIVFDDNGRLNLLAGALKYVDMVRID